jgi:hypothetical protein
VKVSAHSLREAMDRLLHEYPGFKVISDDSAFLSIFVNSKLIRTETEKWDTLSLNSDDEITLIIPIAGG